MKEREEIKRAILIAIACGHEIKARCDSPVYTLFDIKDKIGVINYWNGKDDEFHTTTELGGYYMANTEHFKPFFRRLDQLTEEITHNGDVFIPVVRLAEIAHGTREDGVFEKGDIVLIRSLKKELSHAKTAYVCEHKGLGHQVLTLNYNNGFYSFYHFSPDMSDLCLMVTDNQHEMFSAMHRWGFLVSPIADELFESGSVLDLKTLD